MYTILERMRAEEKLCEFYSDINDYGKCGVGYLIDYDDEFFIVEAVSPDGRHDGFYCDLVENLFKIETDTAYLAGIKKLMPYYSFRREKIDFEGETVLDKMLNYVKSSNKICRLYLGDCRLYGYVTEIAENTVTLALLNQYGDLDGQGTVRLSDVECISFDSEDEIRLEILSKQH